MLKKGWKALFFLFLVPVISCFSQESLERARVVFLEHQPQGVITGKTMDLLNSSISAFFKEYWTWNIQNLVLTREQDSLVESLIIPRDQEERSVSPLPPDREQILRQIGIGGEFSFIIYPQITRLEEKKLDSDQNWVELEITLNFLSLKNSPFLYKETVSSQGVAQERFSALTGAVAELSRQLPYSLIRLPWLKDWIMVIGKHHGELLLNKGKESNLLPGQELYVVDSQNRIIGEVLLKDVLNKTSTALVRYSQRSARVGQSLILRKEMGMSTTVGFRSSLLPLFSQDKEILNALSVTQIARHGFYHLRPIMRWEIPVYYHASTAWEGGFQWSLGGETVLYFGRFSLSSALLGGVAKLFSSGDSASWVSHWGGEVAIAGYYLLTPSINLAVAGSRSVWLSLIQAGESIRNYSLMIGFEFQY